MSFLFLLFSFFFSENGGVKIEKQLLYDRHTLEDNYEYRKVERSFQWDKIAGMIDSLLNFENQAKEFGALSNYKNRNGRAPLSDSSRKDAYRAIEDKYGVKRDQSVPFYKTGNWEVPERYGRDGALVSVIRDSAGFLLVTPSSFGGEWWVPEICRSFGWGRLSEVDIYRPDESKPGYFGAGGFYLVGQEYEPDNDRIA